ncbi:hypothetical protein [Microbacterium sp.]|uniref:hypothetical protein n=1 Tax=Microbacterium sp. TaxID=51671 RepID=UPI003A94D5C5
MPKIKWYLVRRWLYGVAAAAFAIAVYYRLIALEATPLWLALILAAFNTRPPATPDETADN